MDVELNQLTFQKMSYESAREISCWTYPSPYDIYSMDGSEELVQELVEGNYYVAYDSNQQLIGYFCYGHDARVPGGYKIGLYEDQSFVDVGLGLKPNLTGAGLGKSFLEKVLSYLHTLDYTSFRLVVLTTNKRAIIVYLKAGFVPKMVFSSPVNGKNMEFLFMESDKENLGL
ncbi:GNAT family N-acetyltransferase [Evansella tamaricis]|uniref:GNAT family N-acetyltransferase n=1 Tax=Evansella tamaricis TaxID=2069301 RepID=A0ABS6JIZ0_9BACI|nr:GNAT family N-acetyltransferase [Evansella tamaricis]MBU9713639.1 GNAT family N-acetyltransferase [Evansella tamaricis]